MSLFAIASALVDLADHYRDQQGLWRLDAKASKLTLHSQRSEPLAAALRLRYAVAFFVNIFARVRPAIAVLTYSLRSSEKKSCNKFITR